MLNNSKILDVLTPLSDFHRNVVKIKNKDAFSIEPGYWAKITNDGLTNFDFGVQPGDPIPNGNEGLEAMCLNRAKGANHVDHEYEANDGKVGYIAVTRVPGIRVLAGSDYFCDVEGGNEGDYFDETSPNRLEPGNALAPFTIADHVTDPDYTKARIGKLRKVVSGSYSGIANAVIEHVDYKNKTVIYEIQYFTIQ